MLVLRQASATPTTKAITAILAKNLNRMVDLVLEGQLTNRNHKDNQVTKLRRRELYLALYAYSQTPAIGKILTPNRVFRAAALE